MDPVGVVFDHFKAFAKSGHDFFDGVFRRRNPIEILKRLQRESFSDLMKLRDRQEKVEKILSFYKSSNEGPFHEATTRVRGQVDLLGALLFMDNLNQQNVDATNRSGIRSGVNSNFIFETTIRQKDTLSAEFVATKKGKEVLDDHDVEVPLSLRKVCYTANVNDFLSLMAIPMGAQCRDVAVASNSVDQLGKGLTDFSSFGPPLLNLHNGSGIGITVRKSNFIASLAQFVVGLRSSSGSNTMENISSTFGQLVCQFTKGTKLSVLGLHQVPFSSKQHRNFGALAFPIVLSNQDEETELVRERTTQVSAGSIAVMVESELDGFTKIGGWVEMNKLNPKSIQWAITMSDVSEDSFGWGMSLGGMIGDSASSDHFQAETYLKFNLGDKFCLKPGFAYVMDGSSKIGALMIRSNWSL
ncbi:uncharacterized protein LOC130729361 [Lotus japonicus]|uniref:uncharacterized protein LOC130729361 n=1 Tax=Lotus japonicus TaxID=34305 RepID=UPI002590232E|nr:uncharacterized protein LOC130729361 [Lotus japonicus]